MKEYSATIKIENNLLLERIKDQGFESIAEFCRKYNLTYSSVHDCLSLKVPLLDRRGNIKKIWIALSDALQCLPCDLVPQKHITKALDKNTSTFTIDSFEIDNLIETEQKTPERISIENEAESNLSKILLKLPPREEKVIRKRYGFNGVREHTYKEIALELGVIPNRVLQIEKRAIRRLREKYNIKEIKNVYSALLLDA